MISQLALNLAVLGSTLVVVGSTIAEEYVVAVGGRGAVSAPQTGHPPAPPLTSTAQLPSPSATPSITQVPAPVATPRKAQAAVESTPGPRTLSRPPSPSFPVTKTDAPTLQLFAPSGLPTPSHDSSVPDSSVPDLSVPDASVPDSRQFTLASFNVLGDSHTVPGGNRPGWADSTTRMRWAVELLGQHGADLVGFQEFQPPQATDFLEMTGGTWDVYSTPRTTANAVAWKRSQFTLVSGRTIAIPYFNGRMEQMPVVRLRSTESGRELYLANFHNPASTVRHPGSQKWRDEATRREIALVEELRPTGIPILITGDMNEREEFFCRFTASGFMHAAGGGSTGSLCEPPDNMGVDWIFGSEDIMFSGHTLDRSTLARQASDHPLVVSEVSLAPAP